MADDTIPICLRDFIGSNIQSVEQLEILCLLAEDRSRAWSITNVCRCIQSTEKSVREGLQYFVGQGLLAADAQGLFRFSPATPELNASVMKLIKCYRERRVAIIEAIYKKPIESVQHLADVLRIRKDQ